MNTAVVEIELLQRLQPIASLTEEQLRDLATQVRLERLQTGTHLFHLGEQDGHSIYLVRGEVLLTNNTERLTLNGASHEACHPLSPEQPRQMTATAMSEIEVLRFETDLIETMLTWAQFANREPEVILSAEGIISVDKGSWLRKMLRSPTFRNLPAANIEQLLDKLEPIRVHGGDMVIRQGDAGDYFYMIDEGTALVTRVYEDDQGEESIELAELKDGSSFGEAALISDKPRNATVSMISDGVLLRLSKEDFLRLLKEPTQNLLDYASARVRAGRDARWLDVRMKAEYAHAHFPEALNIPVSDLHRHARELDRNLTYICCCDSGRRSSAAAFILGQYGVKAAVLKGGFQHVPHESLISE